MRYSERYEIVGVIDSTKAGKDTGEYLDGTKNNIPIFKDIDEASIRLGTVPDYFIYGIAPLTPFLNPEQRGTIFHAMEMGMNIVNGLPEFLTEDEEFLKKAIICKVTIKDVRKPPMRKDLHNFTGAINDVYTPIIVVMGTDCAVGKRTTALKLVEALRGEGLKAEFITTGQTGILQGSKYGIAVDVLTSGFATGELENAVLMAEKEQEPDIIVVEGQGALSHPAYTSSCAILRGTLPDAVILQHPPKRVNHCDYANFPMPDLDEEIELIESFSTAEVIAITLNHEDMNDLEIDQAIVNYERDFQLPTTDVLKFDCKKLVDKIYEMFPDLIDIKP